MKKTISILLASITLSILLYSCYYDKADYLYRYASTGCDTMNTVSYGGAIQPILDQQCYSCHSGARPSGGVAMGTYNTDKAIAINGMLVGTIAHASGYSPMPAGAAKMDDCSIAKIKKWVEEGSPNN